MEGILAIGGFWLCMLVLVLKKPLTNYLERARVKENKSIVNLTARVHELEAALNTTCKELQELKDNSEYAQKLMLGSVQQAQQLLAMVEKQKGEQLISFQPRQTDIPKLLETTAPPVAEMGKVVNDNTVRFERILPAPVERVWLYLTEPQFLSKWLAEGNVEARVGGRVELNFDVEEMPEREEKGAKIRGLISAYEAPKMIEFSWLDTSNNLESAVSFHLSDHSGQTSLVVTHSRLPQSRMHEFMAGWHTHLDLLKARLSNLAPPIFKKRFNEVVGTYAAVVASVVISAGPAGAANQDSYQTIQTERTHLMSKYDSLWRDADSLQHQISVLKRDASPESARVVDRLDRELQNEYRDLHQVELDIRDLDRAAK